MNDTSSFKLEKPRFANGRPMVLAGLNAPYTLETADAIPAQWEQFAPHIGQLPHQVGKAAYGLCWNYDADGAFDYLSGVQVSEVGDLPEGFTHLEIPAQRYAIFPHRHHVSKIVRTIQAIWGDWLPGSGQEIADTPSFEYYGEDFDPATGTGTIEIWIPLKSLRETL